MHNLQHPGSRVPYGYPSPIYTEQTPGPKLPLVPHRGPTLLVLAILGWLLCPLFALPAFIWRVLT